VPAATTRRSLSPAPGLPDRSASNSSIVSSAKRRMSTDSAAGSDGLPTVTTSSKPSSISLSTAVPVKRVHTFEAEGTFLFRSSTFSKLL
jgi:hypothetical protein